MQKICKYMKKIYLLASVAFLVACGSQKQSKNDPIEKGLDLSAMDTSVRPQDDFYNFVNGKWAKTAQIPADKSTWGTFQILRDKTDFCRRTFLREAKDRKSRICMPLISIGIGAMPRDSSLWDSVL